MRLPGRKVLVVDDTPTVRQTVGDFLSQEGFEVVEATNGLEALQAVKYERPDAVVLDLRMPRLGGLEALKRMRILDPALTVVIMTAYPEDIREPAASLGAAAVLSKPFEMHELLHALRSETTPRSVTVQPAAPSPASQKATPPSGRSLKVLVIDDDPHTGAMLKEF